MVIKIGPLVEKLHKGFSFLARSRVSEEEEEDRLEVATTVPEDVKEGQFVVFAVKGEETQRFVVDLRLLSNPAFLRLLELAEEEYGFNQNGPLKLPCRPHDLHTILQDRS